MLSRLQALKGHLNNVSTRVNLILCCGPTVLWTG